MTIRSKTSELLYINDVNVLVILVKSEEETSVDTSRLTVENFLVESEKTPKSPMRVIWLELVGMDGKKAVDLLKKFYFQT